METPLTRQQLRRARQNLTIEQKQQESAQVLGRLFNMPQIQHAKMIASYQSSNEELQTKAINQTLEHGCQQYCLPILHPFRPGHLLFQKHDSTTKMRRNKFGLDEPALDARHVVPLKDVNVMLVPLVGFDDKCQRIGMGGGYYDRSLIWLNPSCITIGLAFECQKTTHIDVQAWDQSLDFVITSRQVWRRT
ncbi:5-formyltetrahydrofolate cyclo-ligase [Alginatibacterium sediminis]|nr:5-formyltetrahydrofolate cyclo-ligase [Alginatibacterium sediminis]